MVTREELKNIYAPTKHNGYEAVLVKKTFLIAYTLILIFVNYIGPLLLPGTTAVRASEVTATKLIEMTNADRENAGLSSLRSNTLLAAAAHAKAMDMLDNDYWSHFGPQGSTPWQFINTSGYKPYKYAGENLAKGFDTSQGVHQAWMASPTHKGNIMDGRFLDVGIAVVYGKLDDEYVTLVVQMFGTLQSDASLVENVDTEDYNTVVSGGDVEQGDVSSIRITSPSNNEVVTNPSLILEGSLTPTDYSGTVELTDNADMLGRVKQDNDGNWEYVDKRDWLQGDHEVTASATTKEGDTLSDTVAFKVDSKGPGISKDNVDIYDADGSTQVTYYTDESGVTAYITVGNTSVVMDNSEDNTLTTSFDNSLYEDGKDVAIVALDRYGNESRYSLDVIDTGPTIKSVLGVSNSIGAFNIGFGLFILALVALQVRYYSQLKLMAHKGGFIMTLGVWGGLILVVAITKSFGSVF